MIAKGTRVKVVEPDLTYSTYLSFLAKYQCDIENKYLQNFHYGTVPAKDDEFTVLFVANHPDTNKDTICIITNDTNLFMIQRNGLVEIEPIKVGDTVVVTNASEVYSNYEQFMLRHKHELDSVDFWNFQYDCSLPSHMEHNCFFKVLCIDYHGAKWAKDKLVAIIKSADGRVFIINVSGLKKID